eukprot:UN01311
MFRRLLTLSRESILRRTLNFKVFVPKTTAKLWTIPTALVLSTSSMTVAMAERCDPDKGYKAKCRKSKRCHMHSNSYMSRNDIVECQDIVFQWFWNWDLLVNDNNETNQTNYKQFLEQNLDSDWDLVVHGGDEGWTDKHKKDDNYFEFQQGLAEGFVSSFSMISPLCFVEYKYDGITHNQFASFQGTALGNMGVKGGTKTLKKSKMMTTHQKMEITFIKRANCDRWKLYSEESVVTVLDFS